MIDQIIQFVNDLFLNNGPILLYVLTVAVLLVAGLGVPIPEEAVFIAAGIAGHKLDANIWLLCVVGVVGILLGDSIPFFLGQLYGMSLLKRQPFCRIVSEKSIDRTRVFFEKYGTRTVFVARFLAGLRMPTFFLAGAMTLKYRWFLFFDLLGALISCPVSIWLAFTYGEEVEAMLAKSKLAIFIVIGLIVAYTIWHVLSHREKKSVVDEKICASSEVPE